MLFQNKVAVITGAGQGIGKGIALALAQEGCQVVISDLNLKTCEQVAQEIQAVGGPCLAVKCDVSQKAEVDNLIAETLKKFGQLDILVNNAGIFPYLAFDKMQESDWDKVMNVNLKSIFLCSQVASKVIPENGRIISISSIASVVGFEGLVHYCASKGGVSSMTRALALELAGKKITVNAVAPGATDTPGATGVMNDETKNQAVATIPLKRWGTPADIANTVVFLASDKASYITGQTIVVDGGWTLR